MSTGTSPIPQSLSTHTTAATALTHREDSSSFSRFTSYCASFRTRFCICTLPTKGMPLISFPILGFLLPLFTLGPNILSNCDQKHYVILSISSASLGILASLGMTLHSLGFSFEIASRQEEKSLLRPSSSLSCFSYATKGSEDKKGLILYYGLLTVANAICLITSQILCMSK